MRIPCPQCGEPIVKKFLKPFKGKSESPIEVPGGVLKGYDYKCPKCKKQSFYNKETINLLESDT